MEKLMKEVMDMDAEEGNDEQSMLKFNKMLKFQNLNMRNNQQPTNLCGNTNVGLRGPNTQIPSFMPPMFTPNIRMNNPMA